MIYKEGYSSISSMTNANYTGYKTLYPLENAHTNKKVIDEIDKIVPLYYSENFESIINNPLRLGGFPRERIFQ